MTTRLPSPQYHRAAFTLLEVMLAAMAGALILAAIYGVFSKAVRLRNDSTERLRKSRVRARAAQMIRDDLRNAYVSGGVLASTLKGSAETHDSNFPGYLKFTAVNARDDASLDTATGDVQEIEYFVATDPDAGDARTGLLVRTVEHDLLTSLRTTALPQQPILSGVTSMQVSFYDGETWKDTWEYSSDDAPTLPEAVRVTINQAAMGRETTAPPPIEIYVPWTTQPPLASPSPTP
jgi:type II secretory pathway pseudopilin PulG